MRLESEVIQLAGGTAVVAMRGRFTLGSQLSLAESQITALLEQGVRKLVIDLSAVEYMDSAGLGLLMHTYGKLDSSGGLLRVAAPNERVRALLGMTRTDQLLTIDPDRESSLQRLTL